MFLQETVEKLLCQDADVNARDKNWQTPLHVAAANNAVRCAEYIIPLLTNVNVSDRAGRTSLHHAAFNGHKEVRLKLNYINIIFSVSAVSKFYKPVMNVIYPVSCLSCVYMFVT